MDIPATTALPRPAPRLLVAFAAWAVVGLAASLGVLPHAAWTWTGVALALASLIDLLRLWRTATPAVTRGAPDTWPLGVERPVTLAIDGARMQLDVHDLHPGSWRVHGLPRRMRLTPGATASIDYTLASDTRGDFAFAGTQLRLHSPWGLWRQSRVAGTAQRVRVFPNFAPLARLALFGADQASRMVGAHIRRRRGEGTDFHQMREYRVGDSLRQIDWKATARARRLISREYQDEKNQQLVLLLDTGRRLMARDDRLSHFDHVLDAALVVAYLALRQGDAVGALAHGGMEAWVPPRRGMAALDGLMRATYALQPQPHATDFLAAANALAVHQRRRALVMLVTNLRDEDMDDLLAAVRVLRRRHVVCVASLREAALDATLAHEPQDLPAALTVGAAADYLAQRQAAHDALRSHGVLVLDVTADQLAGALVERYLAVKRAGVL